MARKDWDGAELLFWPLLVIVGGIWGGIAAASKHLRETAIIGGAITVLALIVVLVLIANRSQQTPERRAYRANRKRVRDAGEPPRTPVRWW